MHQSGLRALGARLRHRARLRGRRADELRGAQIGLDFPSVGRDREHPDGGGARRGHDRHRQRRPRAGDRRPVRRCWSRWARRSSGAGTATIDHRTASSGCSPTDPPTCRRPDRRRHLGVSRRPSPAATSGARRRPGAPASWRWTSCTTAGAAVDAEPTTASGWSHARAAEGGRRRHPAVSRASRPTCSRWRSRWPRRRRHSMITENVFEARFRFVDELIRLGADARTDGHHAVVRGPRAASERPGVGHRHPGRRRRWCSPAWSPTASPRCTTSSTSTAATRSSWRTCRASARRSSGSAS